MFGEERRDELTRRIDARTFLSRSGAPIREKIGKEKARGRGGGGGVVGIEGWPGRKKAYGDRGKSIFNETRVKIVSYSIGRAGP